MPLDDYAKLYLALRDQIFHTHQTSPSATSTTSAPGHFLTNGRYPLCIFQGASDVWPTATPPPGGTPVTFGDNPLMGTGKMLIPLVIEGLLGNSSTDPLILETLRSIRSLFAFSGDFAGYPVRWDPTSSYDWSDQDPTTAKADDPLGPHALDFLITDQKAYALCTPSDDWRTTRRPTPEELNALPVDQRNRWHSQYWDDYLKQFRDWEPSSDEIIGLVTGLSVVARLGSPTVQAAAKQIISILADYLARHSYFLVRPAGGFCSRGPALGLIGSEWVFNRVFATILGDPHGAQKDTPGVLQAAGVWEPIAGDWTLYGIASFVLTELPPLNHLVDLITEAASDAGGGPLRPATTGATLGQAFALMLNEHVFGCQSSWTETSTGLEIDNGFGSEIAGGHILHQIAPAFRLLLFMNDWVGHKVPFLPDSGFSLGFMPYLGLCGVGDADDLLRTAYLQMYRSRVNKGLGWGSWPFEDAPPQGAFEAAVATLLAADPATSTPDTDLAGLEAHLVALLAQARDNFRQKWNSGLPVALDVPRGHDTERADPGLDYLTALALAWLHASRSTNTGHSLVAGFPQVPSPADLTPIPALAIEPKPPLPAPQPRDGTDPQLAEQVKLLVGPRDGVVDTGITIDPLDYIEINATGSINAGLLFSGQSGPEGWNDDANNANYPKPSGHTKRYCLLGRVGEFGTYFTVGPQFARRRWFWDEPGRLFLTVNTDNHANGSGQFTVQVSRWGRPRQPIGQLWHTIRYSNGSWQPLGLVEQQMTNNPGAFSAISCSGANDPPQLHVAGLAGGRMWHTIRQYDGSWQKQFASVDDQTGNSPAPFNALSCAASNEPSLNLQVVAIAAGRLWHTVRNVEDGTWQEFGDIEGQEANDPGSFTSVTCANVDGWDLHVVGIVDGQLWHTIRAARPDGTSSWQGQFGHIGAGNGPDPGQFTAVSCAGAAGELHVVGLAGGNIWHTIRHADGTWQTFEVVESLAHNTTPGTIGAVAAANVSTNGQPAALHLAATVSGHVWHTIRQSNGIWQDQFGNVDDQVGSSGVASSLTCTGISDDLHLIELV